MGWPWSSSSPSRTPDASADDPLSNRKSGLALTEEQKARMLSRAGFSSQPKSTPTDKPQSQEEQADAELDAFLKSFSAPDTQTGSLPELEVSQTGRHQQPTNHDRVLPDGSLSIHPSALHPRTMSCRAAFDQAFYCQSLGGKFNDIYRFGHLKDCSEQWGAFWFCMRTRTLADDQKQERIRLYYEDREERKKREFGSSEDVWELRTKPVERAFWKNPDEVEGLQRALRKE